MKRGRLHPKARPDPPVGRPASSAKPKRPCPQSQSLSRSYGSNLPTSLTYIAQKLEATNLGDLLRLWARNQASMKPYIRICLASRGTLHTSVNKVLFSSGHPFSKRADSRGYNDYQEKTTLAKAPKLQHKHQLCCHAVPMPTLANIDTIACQSKSNHQYNTHP